MGIIGTESWGHLLEEIQYLSFRKKTMLVDFVKVLSWRTDYS